MLVFAAADLTGTGNLNLTPVRTIRAAIPDSPYLQGWLSTAMVTCTSLNKLARWRSSLQQT